jgi:hypothetical protein
MMAMMLRQKAKSFGCMLSIAVAELRSEAYHTLGKKAEIYPRLTTASRFDFTHQPLSGEKLTSWFCVQYVNRTVLASCQGRCRRRERRRFGLDDEFGVGSVPRGPSLLRRAVQDRAGGGGQGQEATAGPPGAVGTPD